MRKESADSGLTAEQTRAAHSGAKAMMPLGSRPFLDYVLHGLAGVGIDEICMVVAPDHAAIQEHYASPKPTRFTLRFAVQEEPRGTAHALLAAREFAGQEEFLLVNGDNHYPVAALRALCETTGPALAAFDSSTLLDARIPESARAERLMAFSDVRFDGNGELLSITEKPTHPPRWVSMNCWRLTPAIFEACASIAPSARGEWELPSAVEYSREHLGQTYRAISARGPVLDLSSRGDVKWVEDALSAIEVRL
jgi:glucose-1-phosphate thymidylyltransferase